MDSKTATIAGAIIIAGALIAGAVLYSKPFGSAQNQEPEFNPAALRKVDASDHQLGPADSTVKLIVFTDIECPFCKDWHVTLLELSAKYPKLSIVYRHFPIESRHKKAKTEAEATECVAKLAGEEGFWKMISAIFEATPSNDGMDLSKLPALAQASGVTDVSAFTKCLESHETKERVERDTAEAVKTGGNGTPWSILVTPKGNTIPIIGARSIEVMAPAIEEAFKEAE